jgi:S-adenosylmethionine:diacylglycerol 3-amino-3-carboxypropyl transferase
LFQSCFSYKTVDINSIAIDKKQKIEVKGIGGTNMKGTLVFKNEQILTLDNNGQLQKIPMSEIYEVKVRKFSIFKTAIRFAAIYFSVAVFALYAGDLN